MSIHISGSIAYDRIMTFPGKFEDHILPEKLHILNVSFLIDRIEEKRGGTAGNIAYNLALMGEHPLTYSSVGRDFGPYAEAMTALGLPLTGIRRLEETFTASAYITTDQQGNQITGFSPAAMSTACDPAFLPRTNAAADWGIVSPGNVDDMCSFPALYRERKVPFVYDPGQQVIALNGDQVRDGLEGAAVLAGNDYEIEKIGKMTGYSRQQLKEHVGYLITTLGEKGSYVDCKGWEKPVLVPAVKALRIQDPTGAGDAYRAGLLKGLHSGLDIVDSAKLGATCASYCIEFYGTQEHAFTCESFAKRYKGTLGADMSVKW